MKRGFTLIELLAVIIVLTAVIAIVIPVVSSVIRDSKKETILASAKQYFKTIKYTISTENLNDKEIVDGTYSLNDKGNLCLDDGCNDILLIKATGKKPTDGTIIIENEIIMPDSRITLKGYDIVINDDNKVVFLDE